MTYAMLPVVVRDGVLTVDAARSGVAAGYSAESQAEARAHCLSLHPTAVGTVREYLSSDDGPDSAVRGPDGSIIGHIGSAPSTGGTLSLPQDHPGSPRPSLKIAMSFDPAFLASSTIIGAVVHAERLVSELEEAARLQGQAVDAARTAWVEAPKDAQGLTAPDVYEAWAAATGVGDRVSAALASARVALAAILAAIQAAV